MATSNQTLAIEFAQHGCVIFPCKHLAPNEKEPEGGISWKDNSSKDISAVEAWWKRWYPHALVGLPCNQNNLLVID